MHLLLTDRLACPRCGPAFGLILLADRQVERRVVSGHLGCANCRERYPVVEGVADLRPPPRSGPPHEAAIPTAASTESATAVAAGLGVGESRLPVLLLGGAARVAPALVDIVPDDVEVAVAGLGVAPGDASVDATEGTGRVSRLVVGSGLPFFDRSVGGVALTGDEMEPALLREAARVLAGGHRVVVMDPPADAQARLGAAGLTRFLHGGDLAAGGR